MDFVHDALINGRAFRALTVIDQWSRWSPIVEVAHSMSGGAAADALASSHQQAWQTEDDHGRSRHGVHFAWVQISTPAVFGKFGFLLSEGQVTLFQAPDATRPVAMRPLGINWFGNLLEARRLIEDWRQHYNERRPHSSLGYQTPAAFARQFAVAA